MVRLLEAFKTVAFLVDAGCFDDAFKLLAILDQIAMGLELYNHPTYQCGRAGLMAYVDIVVKSPGVWDANEW